MNPTPVPRSRFQIERGGRTSYLEFEPTARAG